MARYGQAFKNKIIARLLPPESASLSAVSQEAGICESTLERWLSTALAEPVQDRVWTPVARFDALLTTTSMDEVTRNAWCRAQGIYPQDLAMWREAAQQGLSEPGQIGFGREAGQA